MNQVNLSLNDQIWGNKSISFCPAGPDPQRDCPSAARPAIPNSSGISPFHPFEPATIAFLRHGYCSQMHLLFRLDFASKEHSADGLLLTVR